MTSFYLASIWVFTDVNCLKGDEDEDEDDSEFDRICNELGVTETGSYGPTYCVELPLKDGEMFDEVVKRVDAAFKHLVT